MPVSGPNEVDWLRECICIGDSTKQKWQETREKRIANTKRSENDTSCFNPNSFFPMRRSHSTSDSSDVERTEIENIEKYDYIIYSVRLERASVLCVLWYERTCMPGNWYFVRHRTRVNGHSQGRTRKNWIIRALYQQRMEQHPRPAVKYMPNVSDDEHQTLPNRFPSSWKGSEHESLDGISEMRKRTEPHTSVTSTRNMILFVPGSQPPYSCIVQVSPSHSTIP